jgi:hypothetical protein
VSVSAPSFAVPTTAAIASDLAVLAASSAYFLAPLIVSDALVSEEVPITALFAVFAASVANAFAP